MRISQKNVHGRRTPSDQSSSSQGAKASFSLRGLSYPKPLRIRKRAHFKAVARERKRFVGRFVIIYYRLNFSPLPRLGLTVPRQYGNAVIRNRFKRVARDAFRQNRERLYPRMEINITPKRNVEQPITCDLVTQDLIDFSAMVYTREHTQQTTTTGC